MVTISRRFDKGRSTKNGFQNNLFIFIQNNYCNLVTQGKYSGFQATGTDRIGAKINTQKNP